MDALTPIDLLQAAHDMGPRRTALVDGGRRYHYADLHTGVRQAAALLAAQGVRRGDRVAHIGVNAAEHVLFLYAAAWLGAVYLPLSPWSAPPELARGLAFAGARCVLLGRSLMNRPLAGVYTRAQRPWAGDVPAIDLCEPALQALLSPGAPAPGDAACPAPVADATLPALMLFSSGTTGQPKGIVYGQGALALQALCINLALRIGAEERFLNVYPAGHYGSVMPALHTAAVGACVVQLPLPHPAQVLDTMARERISFIVAVPEVWRSLLAHPSFDQRDFSALRMANVASDFIPVALMQQIMDRTGAASVQGYGLTETGLATVLPEGLARQRIGSAGLPLPQACVQVRRPDGTPAEVDEAGQIWVRTRYAMLGLWNGSGIDASQTDADGFIDTRDLGHMDADGLLAISGRQDDYMKVSGYRIAAAAIDEVLRRHPAVADAAVVAVAHARTGQAPVAAIVPRPGAEPSAHALADWVAQALSPKAVPVAFWRVPAIPRTGSTGKVQRHELLAWVQAGHLAPLAAAPGDGGTTPAVAEQRP
ncbi:MAG: acyl--CoA ligase [Burkholderiales bacterium]|nr:acyl--CoA ligase [Burkholderiales bacterium]